MLHKIQSVLRESIKVKEEMLSNDEMLLVIRQMSEIITHTFKGGGKVLLCGNGGSAADAQHLAAEFSGRFFLDRKPLFAEALHVNTSYLTAVANDYGYDMAFARMVEAMGRTGDVLWGFSTSGNSPNVLKAIDKAREIGMTSFAFTGAKGGKAAAIADLLLAVPSENTPRIQEAHITVGHIICEMVEQSIFG